MCIKDYIQERSWISVIFQDLLIIDPELFFRVIVYKRVWHLFVYF